MSGSTLQQTSEPRQRVSRRQLVELSARLTLADLDTLGLLATHRFLATSHVAGLVFGSAASQLAGVRAAQRALRKLEQAGLVAALPRRVGGHSGGAAQSVWRLTEAGHRLLRFQTKLGSADDALGGEVGTRTRFTEPSPQFLAHTLRVADIRLVLERLDASAGESGGLSLVQTEPACWRTWVGPFGQSLTLRPDLYAEITAGQYIDLWFIETDMGSEHLPAIVRKAKVYEAYRASGR